MVNISKVMIPWEKVVFCFENEELQEIARTLLTKKISSILVCDNQKSKVLGIISKTDIINGLVSCGFDKTIKAKNLMSSLLIVANESDGRDKVGQMMIENQIHHVIVQDNNQKPVGLVSSTDIVENLVNESKLELGRLLMSIPRMKPVLK
jgi:CBS domain-containing protein